MTEADRKKAAKAFAEYWCDRGDEKSDIFLWAFWTKTPYLQILF